MDKLLRQLLVWTLLLLPAGLTAQADSLAPDGYPSHAWKQANARWKIIRFSAQITTGEGKVYQGQIHSLTEDTLVLWPFRAIFVPGKEEELVKLSVQKIRSIHIQRKRSYWRGVGNAALLLAGPAMLLESGNADGDWLPPAIHLLFAGIVYVTPPALIYGIIYKAGQVDRMFPLTGNVMVDTTTLAKLDKYILFPEGSPNSAEVLAEHPLTFSPQVQQWEQSIAHSPMLKKVFPKHTVDLELYLGAGLRASTAKMLTAMGEETSRAERLDPAIQGLGAMVRVRPHWRVGATAFTSTNAYLQTFQRPTESERGYSKVYAVGLLFSLTPMLEYVHQPMHRMLLNRFEWSAAGGVGLILSPRDVQMNYTDAAGHPGYFQQKTEKLPGLLLQTRARYYLHKHLSAGIMGQLNLVPSFQVEEAVLHEPALGPRVTIEAHSVNLSSAMISWTVGVHF